MVTIESYPVAVAMCVITMLCWGSWANTQKLATKEWRFQLFYWDYAIGVLLLALLLAFTLGSTGRGGRGFLADLVVAARITPKLLAGAQGEAVVNVKELIDRPEQAAALLSKVCIRVFEGETNLRSTARSLDYLAYGAEMRARGPNIAGAMFKAVGDQEAGNVTDSAEGHVSANGV